MSKQEAKKVIVIDPVNETVSETRYKSYEEIYDLGNFDLFTCSIVDYNSDIDKGNDLFIDDEGLLKRKQRYFTFTGVGTFAGRGLLIGTNYSTGESISTSWTLDQAIRAVSFEPEGFKIDPYMQFIGLN